MRVLVLRSAALGSSQTWADMSISLGRDNLLPSSVFRKSSKHPEEREAAAALLQMAPPRPASLLQVWAAPHRARSKWHSVGLLSTERKSIHSVRVPSALQNSNLGPHSTQGAADMLRATHRRLVFSQVQCHKPGSQEHNLLL